MKRLLILLLAAVLLAGCGSISLTPSKTEAPPVQTPPPAPPQEPLRYYLDYNVELPESLSAYAAGRGIPLEQVNSELEAGISILSYCPYYDHHDLSQDTLMVQGARLMELELAQGQQAIPLSMGRYGYVVDPAVLSEMLDGADALEDLQAATYDEWDWFVKLASGWMAGTKVSAATLNGKEYPFAAEKGDLTRNLDDVFAIDCQQGFGAYALAPAFAAAGASLNAETLTGPLNSVWETFFLETGHLATCGRGSAIISGIDAASARAMFSDGRALFLRTAAAPGETVLPVKYSFEKSDLAPDTGWTPEALSQSYIQSPGLWAAISEDAEPSQADLGLGYLLWLYTAPGSPMLDNESRDIPVPVLTREQEALVNSAVTRQLSLKKWETEQRTQYTEAVLAAVAEITE